MHCICLFSPGPTGKTFIGSNLSVALAKAGHQVVYMDASKISCAATWFGGEKLPYYHPNLSLKVCPYDPQYLPSEGYLIIETDQVEKIPDGASVFLVIDSDFAHLVDVIQNITSLHPEGIIWNKADLTNNPGKRIPLPIVCQIPFYNDVNARIQLGEPRALVDETLSEVLVHIPTHKRMNTMVKNL